MESRKNSLVSTTSAKSAIPRDVLVDNLITIDEKFLYNSVKKRKGGASLNNGLNNNSGTIDTLHSGTIDGSRSMNDIDGYHKNLNGIYYFPNGEVFKPRSNNHQKRTKPDRIEKGDRIDRGDRRTDVLDRRSLCSNLLSASSSSINSLNYQNFNNSHIQRSYSNPNFVNIPLDLVLKNSLKKGSLTRDLRSSLTSDLRLGDLKNSLPRGSSTNDLRMGSTNDLRMGSSTDLKMNGSSTDLRMNQRSLTARGDRGSNDFRTDFRVPNNSRSPTRSIPGNGPSFIVPFPEDSFKAAIPKHIPLKNYNSSPQNLSLQSLSEKDTHGFSSISSATSSFSSASSNSIPESNNNTNSSNLIKPLTPNIVKPPSVPILLPILDNQQSTENLVKEDDSMYLENIPNIPGGFVNHEESEATIRYKNTIEENSETETESIKHERNQRVNSNENYFNNRKEDNNKENWSNSTSIDESEDFIEKQDYIDPIKTPIKDKFDETHPPITTTLLPITPSRQLIANDRSPGSSSYPSPDAALRSNRASLNKQFFRDMNNIDNKVENKVENEYFDTSKAESSNESDVPPRRDLIRTNSTRIINDPGVPSRRDLQSGSIRSKRISSCGDTITPSRSFSNSILDSPAVLLAQNSKTISQSDGDELSFDASIQKSQTEVNKSVSPVRKVVSKSPTPPSVKRTEMHQSVEKNDAPTKPKSKFKRFFCKLFGGKSSNKEAKPKASFSASNQNLDFTAPIIQPPVEKTNFESNPNLPELPPKDPEKVYKSKPATIPVKIAAPIFDSPHSSLRFRPSKVFGKLSNSSSHKDMAKLTKVEVPIDRTSWKFDESLTLTKLQLPDITSENGELMDDMMNTFDQMDYEKDDDVGKLQPLDIYDSTGHLKKSTGTLRSHKSIRSDIFMKDDELTKEQIKDQQMKDSMIVAGSSSTSLEDSYVDENIRFLQNEFNWKDYGDGKFEQDEESIRNSKDFTKFYTSQKDEGGNGEVLLINQDQLIDVFQTSQRNHLPSQIKYLKQFQDFKNVKVEYQEYEDLTDKGKINTSGISKANSILKKGKSSKKLVMFSNRLIINETFAPDMYKRYNKSVTQYTLTDPGDIAKIKFELNQYKSKEMLVHEQSQNNTHFFYN